MGFLTRLFSIRTRSKRKHDKNDKTTKNAASTSSTRLLSIPQDEEAVVNRLLRSSSTHFSVLSETEYRSLPPIPHPINNVLRPPSIISTATQTDTYTVKILHRVLHSRTEFPNANHTGDATPTPSQSPTRRHSSPQLTPGDRNRLSRLRQDASVLSLLDIYDDAGRLDPQAFSNTPARRDHHDASLRVLLGNPAPPSLTNSKTSAEESDISWAERYMRSTRSNSTSSSRTSSSLGIPVDLFKSSISPERLYFDPLDTTSSSRDIDVGIDSMQVERGTAEDSPMALHALTIGLTSPTRRASQFFKFLADTPNAETPPADPALDAISPPSLHDSHTLTTTASTAVDDKPVPGTKIPVLFVRDGPRESFAHVSPAKTTRPKPSPLGHRTPLDDLRNADESDPKTTTTTGAAQTQTRTVSTRSVSVASSIHPSIEQTTPDTDPYTPFAPRRAADGKRAYHSLLTGENVPPCAPARPVRGQARKYAASRDCPCPRPARRSTPISPPRKLVPAPASFQATPPTTPVRNTALAHLRHPPPASPASSSELSPEGRRIMASARSSRARKPSQNKPMTPRTWRALAPPPDAGD